MNTVLSLNKIFIPLVLVLLFAGLSHSSPTFDPRLIPSETTTELLEVKWKERGGMIVTDSVCFNYPEESNEHKGCMQLATDRFKRECEDFKLLYYNSRPRYDEEYKRGMEKFCDALDELTD